MSEQEDSYLSGSKRQANTDAAAGAAVGTQALSSASAVVIELFRAAAANPMVAGAAVVVAADILHNTGRTYTEGDVTLTVGPLKLSYPQQTTTKQGLISDIAFDAILGIVAAGEIADVLAPSVQTLVYGNGQGNSAETLAALLPLLALIPK